MSRSIVLVVTSCYSCKLKVHAKTNIKKVITSKQSNTSSIIWFRTPPMHCLGNVQMQLFGNKGATFVLTSNLESNSTSG